MAIGKESRTVWVLGSGSVIDLGLELYEGQEEKRPLFVHLFAISSEQEAEEVQKSQGRLAEEMYVEGGYRIGADLVAAR